ncbi:MAG: 50S ribosomal protein L31e [Candidatus Aenigmatarchaeota archaeon]
MAEERILTLNLRKELEKTRRVKKAKRVVTLLRNKIQKMFKGFDVKIDKSVNEEIWKKGAKKPPAKLKLRIKKEEKVVKVELEKAII